MILKLALILLCVILAAIFNAGMDKLVHHYSSSIFNGNKPLFWDPAQSWRNKYKNYPTDKRPKFPFATTILVWATDGWHLFKQGMLSTQAVPWAFCIYWILPDGWNSPWHWLAIYIGVRILWAGTFHIFYHRIFERKDERSI